MKRENQTGKEEHMSKNYPQMATDLTRAIGTMRKGIPEPKLSKHSTSSPRRRVDRR